MLLALVTVVTGMQLFLPRLTAVEKVLIPVGMLLALTALVVLLLRLVQ